MAETKYGKYFVTYDPEKWPPMRTPVVIRLEDSVVKGSNFYFVHWVLPGQAEMREDPAFIVGHPPHTHKDHEILMFIGTDPNNPMELGAECELYMGPEMEKHVINKTSAVYVPANLIHCPFKVLKTVRPWILIQIHQGPAHTEELHPEVLPKEVRDKVDWNFWERMATSWSEKK